MLAISLARTVWSLLLPDRRASHTWAQSLLRAGCAENMVPRPATIIWQPAGSIDRSLTGLGSALPTNAAQACCTSSCNFVGIPNWSSTFRSRATSPAFRYPRRLRRLVVHEPLPYDARSGHRGHESIIGRKAPPVPGGVLVSDEPWQHAEATVRTAALMNDARVPAIFEAAFEYDGIRIRVDVMERLADGAWGLREVKSSSGLKDHYLDDIALQTYVLRGAGVAVSSIELLHVNTAYVRGPGAICWTDFFARMDVGAEVAARLTDLPSRLPARYVTTAMAAPRASSREAVRFTLHLRVQGSVHGGKARRLDRLSPAPCSARATELEQLNVFSPRSRISLRRTGHHPDDRPAGGHSVAPELPCSASYGPPLLSGLGDDAADSRTRRGPIRPSLSNGHCTRPRAMASCVTANSSRTAPATQDVGSPKR